MKNKPLLFSLIYCGLFIAGICITFFGHYNRAFDKIYVMGMAAILPFVIMVIRTQRETVYHGQITGREAAREGMRFVFFSFIILVTFQVIFFYGGYREYRIDYLMKGEMDYISQGIQDGKIKANPTDLRLQARAVAGQLSMINISTEIFGVFLRTIVVGLFSSFVCSIFMKKGEM
jgi:hypothetical protein